MREISAVKSLLQAECESGLFGSTELTADAFFQYRGQRAYRTGDLGRLRDNLLFFEGRMDEQIKLSGYRIELVTSK